MPYSIDKYDGTTITVVEDGTINNTLDIKLVGKDYPGYGEIQNENFVFMLENFAGGSSPPRPINGQIWFDSDARKLKYYDAAGTRWRSTGGTEFADIPPTGMGDGDLWFDTHNQQLNVWNGTSFVMVGPQSVYDKGRTQLRSRGVLDDAGGTHAIIEGFVNGNVVYIISNDTAFTLHPDMVAEYSNRYTKIKPGLNLTYTNDDGITTDLYHKYWGTASNSDRLGGKLPSYYFSKDNTRFPDAGFTVGDDDDLHVFIDQNSIPTLENQLSSNILFKVKSGTTSVTPMLISGNSIVPGVTNQTTIGTSSLRFSTMYATTFDGTATTSNAMVVNGSNNVASVGAAASTIAARDGSGNLTANVFNGTATKARYADLAEKYLTDKEYDVGTVMVIGGEKEATESSQNERAIGVISQYPAYMMNCDLEDGQYIALKGRVPVKVLGKVSKGDRLIAWNNGIAIPSAGSYDVFAIAIESSDDAGIKLIEALVL